jgi:hypothetical protein
VARDWPHPTEKDRDWPHPTEKDKPNDAVLFDLLAEWVPDVYGHSGRQPCHPVRIYEIRLT